MVKNHRYFYIFIVCALLLGSLAHATDHPTDEPVPTQAPTPPTAVMPDTPSPPEQPPDTGPEPNERIVNSTEELFDWLHDHMNQGGTVRLGADLVVDRPSPTRAPTAPINIIAGAFTIYLKSGGVWQLPGPVTITGSKTVFYVEEGGRLELHHQSSIRAEGSGAAAVVTEDPVGIVGRLGSIEAHGSGTTAIHAPGGLTLSAAAIAADGENACAIRGSGDVDLTYCTITATGEGSLSVSTPGGILLDTAVVSPQAAGAKLLTRNVQYPKTILYVVLGAQPELPSFVRVTLTLEEREPLVINMPLSWPDQVLDTNREKSIELSAAAYPPFPEISASFPALHTAQLYVIDPDLPRLVSATISNDLLLLNTLYIRNALRYSIHFSGDGGKSWETVHLSGDERLFVENIFPAESTQLFYYEEVQMDGTVMRSNLLEVYFGADGLSISLGNGDYDGGDQGGGGSPKPPFGWPTPPTAGEETPPTPAPPLFSAPPTSDAMPPATPGAFPMISIIPPMPAPPPDGASAPPDSSHLFVGAAPAAIPSAAYIPTPAAPSPALPSAAAPPPPVSTAGRHESPGLAADPDQKGHEPAAKITPSQDAQLNRWVIPAVTATGAVSLLLGILLGMAIHRRCR